MTQSLLVAADNAKTALLNTPITNKQQVDKIFDDANITSLDDRIIILRQSMGVRWSSDCHSKDISADLRYRDEVAIFLDGTWRLLQA